MSHVVCKTHGRRVMVITPPITSNELLWSKVVHRNDGTVCDTRTVVINKAEFSATLI
jgi:hypothetical protein